MKQISIVQAQLICFFGQKMSPVKKCPTGSTSCCSQECQGPDPVGHHSGHITANGGTPGFPTCRGATRNSYYEVCLCRWGSLHRHSQGFRVLILQENCQDVQNLIPEAPGAAVWSDWRKQAAPNSLHALTLKQTDVCYKTTAQTNTILCHGHKFGSLWYDKGHEWQHILWQHKGNIHLPKS